MKVVLQVLKLRDAGQIFVYFARKSVPSSLRQVHPVIFRSSKFLSRLTKLQRCWHPASEQDKFLSGVKSDRFVNLHAMIWRKMSIENLTSIFSRSIAVWTPPKLFLEPAAVEQGEASTGIVEVATASAGVERIQGRKKTRIQAIICRGNRFDRSG